MKINKSDHPKGKKCKFVNIAALAINSICYHIIIWSTYQTPFQKTNYVLLNRNISMPWQIFEQPCECSSSPLTIGSEIWPLTYLKCHVSMLSYSWSNQDQSNTGDMYYCTGHTICLHQSSLPQHKQIMQYDCSRDFFHSCMTFTGNIFLFCPFSLWLFCVCRWCW